MIMPRLVAARFAQSVAFAPLLQHWLDNWHIKMSILAIVSTAMAPLDRELPYRATGRRDAERDRTLLARRLSGDGTEARPNPGRLHANPTDHFAARQTRPAVANAVMNMPAT